MARARGGRQARRVEASRTDRRRGRPRRGLANRRAHSVRRRTARRKARRRDRHPRRRAPATAPRALRARLRPWVALRRRIVARRISCPLHAPETPRRLRRRDRDVALAVVRSRQGRRVRSRAEEPVSIADLPRRGGARRWRADATTRGEIRGTLPPPALVRAGTGRASRSSQPDAGGRTRRSRRTTVAQSISKGASRPLRAPTGDGRLV